MNHRRQCIMFFCMRVFISKGSIKQTQAYRNAYGIGNDTYDSYYKGHSRCCAKYWFQNCEAQESNSRRAAY